MQERANIRLSQVVKSVALMALAALCCMAIAACGKQNTAPSSSDATLNMADTSGGVAATVGDAQIGENAVTAYIEAIRSSQGLEDDAAWAQWLVDNGLTPSDVRSQVIQSFEQMVLLRQAAADQGVTVNSDDIDSQIETLKSMYGGEDSWNQVLESSGISEEYYRNMLELQSLQSGLSDKVTADVTASDADLLAQVQQNLSTLNGAKRSSHILFSSDDEATAQQVLDQLNAGTISFEDAAAQYSIDTGSASKGGDVGWDKTTGFVQAYQEALDKLSPGEMSGLVTSNYGIHIIKCTDQFAVVGDLTSLSQVPSDLLESLRSSADQQAKSQAYSTWMQDYQSKAKIKVNDMPKNLPYDVDLTGYTKSTTSTGSTAAATSEAGTESTGQ